jgi:ligand-binding sensor domain-containing protein
LCGFWGTIIGDSLYFSNFDGLAVVHKKNFMGRNISKHTPPLNITNQPWNSPYYISAVKKDANNTLYVVGFLPSLENLPVFHKKSNTNWTSYNLPLPSGRIVINMIIDDFGNKWLYSSHTAFIQGNYLNGEGLLVFNENLGLSKHVNSIPGNGNLTSNKVYCIEKAQNGEIWVGTDNGVCVFYQPDRVLKSSSGWDAAVPVYDSRALLREKTVTAIKADPGDRKWIGTQSEGVWLFNSDGSQLIYHFRTDNSPLPSNNILAIEINPRNGEVIFSTDKGIAVFREGVSAVSENTNEVEIFPNPVPHNFSGKITIRSLGQDAIVKITDVTGNLVYQTQAFGATAFWDGNDLSGKRVTSGIYLVFSSTKNGDNRLVGKFLVLN